jgi:3-hydroxyacyl-CoA dehydrogenase / 3-hydroxy-2-methylbutyryl-CoA dehydrogenase
VAILDMNEDMGNAFAKDLGSSAKFFVCDVLDTDSITAAVQGTVAWIKQTGKPMGGVIPAAGVGNPATVSFQR